MMYWFNPGACTNRALYAICVRPLCALENGEGVTECYTGGTNAFLVWKFLKQLIWPMWASFLTLIKTLPEFTLFLCDLFYHYESISWPIWFKVPIKAFDTICNLIRWFWYKPVVNWNFAHRSIGPQFTTLKAGNSWS